MDYFPLFLKLQGQRCLLAGGGEIAARKARLLLQAGASMTVVAPELNAELAVWRDAGQLQHLAAHYAASQLDGQRLVIAATDDAGVNAQIFADCEARNILVNAVDSPEHCRFIVPAIVDRSPVVVAISSGGNAPVLARILKARLETLLPSGLGALASLAGKLRATVKARLADEAARRRFWETALDGPAAEQAMAGDITSAEAMLHTQLAQADAAASTGAVYLVGAGPGNPDLLTFRALHLMQKSDVVLYDNLVSPQILALVRRDAERIYVGKKANNHALPQEDINRLLVRLAQEGKRVLRLKGGDPFIFGRGGEEIEELASAGIIFEVVPGITSASGASCYAGIPLTHRDYAQSVTFVTGHRRADQIELDWPRLVSPSETVVIYMGVAQAPSICAQLIAHGRAATTPVAIVERATWPDQRTLLGTLETLPGLIAQHTIKPPALIIVGEVVQLHERLAWR
ncbi:Siroheme synthase [Andreprevotia sp. IGB-42]|uniref:siroheme synthase CysG n=1 Tax=Andreprevotia sp. IGB-42 TaxID=2497473 RepID=UPI00135C9B8A|nr:siroheme synthase CysG [Andreprevotia sp. IGB-42]KAF0813178.1 Siroheme synthase [Andreprevotia sp. IGB-42]